MPSVWGTPHSLINCNFTPRIKSNALLFAETCPLLPPLMGVWKVPNSMKPPSSSSTPAPSVSSLVAAILFPPTHPQHLASSLSLLFPHISLLRMSPLKLSKVMQSGQGHTAPKWPDPGPCSEQPRLPPLSDLTPLQVLSPLL